MKPLNHSTGKLGNKVAPLTRRGTYNINFVDHEGTTRIEDSYGKARSGMRKDFSYYCFTIPESKERRGFHTVRGARGAPNEGQTRGKKSL